MLARICLNGVFVRVCILFVFCVLFSVALIVFRKRDKGQKGDEWERRKGNEQVTLV